MKFLRLLFVTAILAAPASAAAQPAPGHMCGSTPTAEPATLTITLPGKSLGIDDTRGFFRKIDVPEVGPADSITLPNGCSIYAFLVAGYSQNRNFNEIVFYKLAEFVAKNNGYVHVSWWNNLLSPYMAGPLHPRTIVIERLFGLLQPIVIPPTPAFSENLLENLVTFVPLDLDLPKANPDEDFQFQSDMALVIKTIRDHNPNAIIVVAGHSMGAASVARLGLNKTLQIDLLAPIDPGNNRDMPYGILGTNTANRSRWRTTFEWRGYKQWDCKRNSNGFCKDFDDRLFVFRGECTEVGPFLLTQPVLATRPNIGCFRLFPYVDTGFKNVWSDNIKHLYHRWQTEFGPPSDFLQSYPFASTQLASASIFGRNYQKPFPAAITTTDPNSTCRFGPDPRDPARSCQPEDGHGEIIGHRGPLGEEKVALAMRNWPTTIEGRRAAMLELPTAPPSWARRPENPDLCLVCDDMIAIVQHLLDSAPTSSPPQDTTAPLAVATASPNANDAGWNNSDVVLMVTAVDETQGSGVKEIQKALTGAETANVVTPGADAQLTVSAEGMTTLTFFARDNRGNAGAPETLTVKLDKTGPAITGDTDGAPNAHGWFKRNVTVSFTATDEPGGSGLLTVSVIDNGVQLQKPSVVVSFESENQAITGMAQDVAENQSDATVTLSIDKTPPAIALDSRTVANAFGWNKADVDVAWGCTDSLSGAVSQSVTQTVSTEGAGQQATGTCLDFADNTSTHTVGDINIDKTAPMIALVSRTAQNSAGWNNTDVALSWSCTDLLSRVVSATVGQTLSNEGVGQPATGLCTDKADNESSDTVTGINIDKTAPAISIVSPPDGAIFLLNGPATANFGCADALSGPATCVGSTPNGGALDTSTVGGKSLIVTATDVAGNAATAASSYAVRYVFSGFASPIAAPTLMTTARAGRTIPIKYVLSDGNGTVIMDLASFASLTSKPIACDGSSEGGVAEETEAPGSTLITFADGTFQYNWKTESSWTGCRLLELKLNDGALHTAKFQFR